MAIKMEIKEIHRELQNAANGLEETFTGARHCDQPFLNESELDEVLETLEQMKKIILTNKPQLIKKD